MTKAERFFDLLGHVDSSLLEEAASPASLSPPQKKLRWKGWALAAACLLLVAAAPHLVPRMGNAAPDKEAPPSTAETPAASSSPYGEYEPGDAPDAAGSLPILETGSQFSEGGGGIGIWTDNVDHHISGGLLFARMPDTLPVYYSCAQDGSTPLPTLETAMEELLAVMLNRFDMTGEDCRITRFGASGTEAAPGEGLSRVTAVLPDGTELSVNHRLTVTVLLSPHHISDAILLADRTTPEGMEALGSAVIEELGWLLEMENPVPVITGGDVDLYNRRLYALEIRDGDTLPALARPAASGFGFSNGRLIVRLDTRYDREFVGEYPIITQEEARELLLTGDWVGRTKYDPLPAGEQILRTELVYMTNPDGFTMPYYQFYLDTGDSVELRESEATQRPTGETVPIIQFCYVPAVEAAYLTPGTALTFNS